MKIKIMAFNLLAFLGLTNCNQNSTKNTEGQISFDKEIFTLYSKSENIINAARLLPNANDNFDLLFYTVDISTPEGAKQKFISVEQLTQEQLVNKKNELQKTFNWTPFKGNSVLFVQIQPTGFKDEMELLDKRQEIEDKLNSAIETKKLGEWFAGDIGPGGGNMLYTVTNINDAMQVILQVLKQNNLDKNILIGRRIMTAKDDWYYEVIYPTKYTGDFNTM